MKEKRNRSMSTIHIEAQDPKKMPVSLETIGKMTQNRRSFVMDITQEEFDAMTLEDLKAMRKDIISEHTRFYIEWEVERRKQGLPENWPNDDT